MRYINNFLPYIEEKNFKKINTKISIHDIESNILKILDKYSQICKNYIHIDDSCLCISFDTDIDQIKGILNTSFEIKIYDDGNKNAIIGLSKKIYENQHWSPLLNDLLQELK